MSDPILPLLVLIVVALLVLGGVARLVARGSRQAVGLAGAALCGLGFLLTMLGLIMGQRLTTLVLPLGPPGLPLSLVFDPLAGFFLLPIFLTGTASIAFAAEVGESSPKASLAGLALGLAGVVLALLAASAVTLSIGLAIAGASVWAGGEPGRARAATLGVTALAVMAVLGATAAAGFDFATLKGQLDSPALLFALTWFGPGALAGLAPFHRWSIPAHRAAPARSAVLLSGAVQPLALYMLVRLLLDLGGTAPPGWWGLVLLAVGTVTALTGGWRAASEVEIGACLAGLTERQSGLASVGLGLALIGRTSDLSLLTSLAQAAVLLLAFSQAVCGTLAQIAAEAVHSEAGSRRLVSLGGLTRSMPVASIGMGVALVGFSALPAGVGFSAFWLLFQALLAAPRTPVMALVAMALAGSATLSGVALVRVFGVAFLGRPRGPRAASALDIAKATRPGMLALAGVATAIGMFPGAVLMLAEPALRQLHSGGLEDRIGPLDYPTLPLLLVALVTGTAVYWLFKRRGIGVPRQSPAWNDGFAPPPAWLPFGDPVTQPAGEGFLPSLPKFWLPELKRTSRPNRVPAMLALLAAIGVFLTVLLWMRGA